MINAKKKFVEHAYRTGCISNVGIPTWLADLATQIQICLPKGEQADWAKNFAICLPEPVFFVQDLSRSWSIGDSREKIRKPFMRAIRAHEYADVKDMWSCIGQAIFHTWELEQTAWSAVRVACRAQAEKAGELACMKLESSSEAERNAETKAWQQYSTALLGIMETC